jgi:hypothetical protein
MKRELLICSIACMLALPSAAFAGAYGEREDAVETPASAPAPQPAYEEESEEPVLRSFASFITDAETSRGLWVELGSLYFNNDVSDLIDIDGAHTFLHISYGQEMFEGGILIPYEYVNADVNGPAFLDFEGNGIGDISLWGKVVPVRTDMFTLGIGMSASFPSGDQQAFTTDEYGFNPFLSAGFVAGPVHIGTSLGYSRFTDAERSDALTYSATVLAPIGEMVVLRGEFVGSHWADLHQNEGNGPTSSDIIASGGIGDDPVSFVPGIDIIFPMGDAQLMLRPTGAVGISDTADWQAGLSIAFAQI